MTAIKPSLEDRYAPLLTRRVPRANVVLGRAYIIHARNGGVGIALEAHGKLGYQLHREKFERHYLFVEYDWDEGAPFGTAIPIDAIVEMPPKPLKSDKELLAWLSDQEAKHRAQIDAAWQIVLGSHRAR